MARIAEASLEEIRERTDIVELVREYVPNLKKGGRNWKACCPFHQEKTPSFMVNPEKQIYHCFGCGEGGDAFAFLMKMEGLSFPEAIEKLAERAGVRLAKTERTVGPREKERKAVRDALEFAREHYHEQLRELPEAKAARDYLERRGVDRATIAQFKLGYASRGGSLLQAALAKGFKPEALRKAGLAAERKGRVREYFWNRVLYPILNARGETAGFGARTLGDGEPKYLNSPDGPLFSKSKVLYGLHDALPMMRKHRAALLLEGYMDVMAAHQFGLRYACAPLGTALTEGHIALLKRYVDRVCIVFDPDAAGAAAAVRGAELCLEKDLAVSILSLPDGLDPDEFLHQRGPEALHKALSGAEGLAPFMIGQLLKGRRRPLKPEDKQRVAKRVLETVRKSQDEVLKDEWIRLLAERLEVSQEALQRELHKESRPARRNAAARPGSKTEPGKPLPVEERDVLFLLFKSPALGAAAELVDASDFTDERARRIFEAFRSILQCSESHESWSARLLEALEEGEAVLAREVLCDPREVKDPAKVVAEIVGRVRKRRRLAEIEPLVLDRKGPVDPEIYQEYNRLLCELKGTRKGV